MNWLSCTLFSFPSLLLGRQRFGWTLSVLLSPLLLGGCASVTKGTSQTISFDLFPAATKCLLSLEGKGNLGSVSGESSLITVKKGRHNITAVCSASGFETATYLVRSFTDNAAVMGAAIDFGITDMVTGAMWIYPERVQVRLQSLNSAESGVTTQLTVESERSQDDDQLTSSKEHAVMNKALQVRASQSTLDLDVSSSEPDVGGLVILSVNTKSDTLSLKINGDEAGSSADGVYSLTRFVQVGETRFEVVATDRFGNTKTQLVSVTRKAADTTVRFSALDPTAIRVRPPQDAVAIIIGIQEYRRVPKAEFASNDARSFYDYAIRGLGVKPENIKLLLDQEADEVGILGALQNWLPLKTRKAQTDVYVFYSGHGLPSDDGGSLYLLPHGVDRQFLDRTAIKQSEVVSALQAANPKSVTLFMDACYSGQIRTGETLLASARPIVIAPRASSFPANFTVLTASAPDQLASSSPDLKHGVFSYYLMKGMEGEADQNKDGAITVQEMQSYLKDSVGRKAMALNRTQQPQVVGDQSRVLVGR